MQHNINLYSYIGSPDAFVKAWYCVDQLRVTGPGLPLPITRPSIFTTGMISAPGAGQKALVRIEQVVAGQVRFADLQARLRGQLHHHCRA